MINAQIFITGFKKLQLTFEFDPNTEYQEMVYDALKDQINDKIFFNQCSKILLSMTKKEWNDKHGYKGRPSIKDWLEMIIPKLEKTNKRIPAPWNPEWEKTDELAYPKDYQDFLDSKKPKKLN